LKKAGFAVIANLLEETGMEFKKFFILYSRPFIHISAILR